MTYVYTLYSMLSLWMVHVYSFCALYWCEALTAVYWPRSFLCWNDRKKIYSCNSSSSYDYCMSRGWVFYGCVYTELIGYGLCVMGLLHFTLQFIPRGVTPIDSIVTAVTTLVNPYTKAGVESLHILPYTSVNVHVVNGWNSTQSAVKAQKSAWSTIKMLKRAGQSFDLAVTAVTRVYESDIPLMP